MLIGISVAQRVDGIQECCNVHGRLLSRAMLNNVDSIVYLNFLTLTFHTVYSHKSLKCPAPTLQNISTIKIEANTGQAISAKYSSSTGACNDIRLVWAQKGQMNNLQCVHTYYTTQRKIGEQNRSVRLYTSFVDSVDMEQ